MSLPLRVSRIWAYGPTDDLCSESSELPPRSPTPPPSGRAGPRPGRHQTQPGSSSRPSTPEGSPRRELRSPLPPPAPSRADLAAADSPEDTFGTGDRSGDLRAAYNGLHAVVTRLQDADRRRTDISRVSTIVAVDTLECRVTLATTALENAASWIWAFGPEDTAPSTSSSPLASAPRSGHNRPRQARLFAHKPGGPCTHQSQPSAAIGAHAPAPSCARPGPANPYFSVSPGTQARGRRAAVHPARSDGLSQPWLPIAPAPRTRPMAAATTTPVRTPLAQRASAIETFNAFDLRCVLSLHTVHRTTPRTHASAASVAIRSLRTVTFRPARKRSHRHAAARSLRTRSPHAHARNVTPSLARYALARRLVVVQPSAPHCDLPGLGLGW